MLHWFDRLLWVLRGRPMLWRCRCYGNGDAGIDVTALREEMM